MGNPWVAGNFFSGQFLTETNPILTNPFRDERQCILIEIEAIKQTSLLPFTGALPEGAIFYYINTSGTLTFISDLDTFVNTNDIRWSFLGGSIYPSVYVMTDENGTTQYLSYDFQGIQDLVVTTSFPLAFPLSKARFVGPYLELLDENGTDIYRLTVQSDLSIHIDLHRSESERIQSITVSNGHPFAFRIDRTYIEALVELGSISSEVPRSEFGFSGLTQPKIGIIKISLHDGGFDFLTDQDWDNRDITLYIGSTDVDPALYPIGIRGKTEGATWNQNTLSITLQDSGNLWKQPMQENFYLGTGGYEGSAENEGNVKPQLFGQAYVMEPVPIDETLNLYQIHDGPIHSMGGVYQGGVPLITLGDFPGTLLTWIPTPTEIAQGSYRTDLSRGMFRLAAPPGASVLVRTANGDSGISQFSNFMGPVIQRILELKLPTISIDQTSFTDFTNSNIHIFQSGIYIREEATVGEIMRKLLHSCGGSLSLTRLNELRISALHQGPAINYFITADIQEGSLRRESPGLPAKSYRFGYRKVNKVLSETDFLGAADSLFRLLSTSEYRYKTYGPFNSAIANRAPSGKVKTLDTFLQEPSDADQFGERMVQREHAFRDVYIITVFGYSFTFNIGDIVQVELDRWGMDVPKAFVIVGITEKSPTGPTENLTTLKLWG